MSDEGKKLQQQISNINFEIILKDMKAKLPMIKEHYKIIAELHRSKFDALKAQGFTDAQALELCKDIFCKE